MSGTPLPPGGRITPMILTCNEAANIRRTVERLLWAPRILVVDSFSSDETLAILRAYPQVEIVQHPFVDFASQCNFGLTQVTSPWGLSLDADYLLAPPRKALGRADRLRLLGWPAPIAAFAYALLVKGCVFDGWRGWYYVLQRVIAEAMLALEIVDRRLRRDASPVREAAGEQ